MILRGVQVGGVGANCYIIGCEETREGAIIDPGGGAESILRIVREENLKIKYIINTHGHIDHIGANTRIKEATGADILIHEKDAKMLTSAAANFSMLMGQRITSPPASRLLKDGDIIKVGTTIELEVIHTLVIHPVVSVWLPATSYSPRIHCLPAPLATRFSRRLYKTLINSIKES